MSEEASNRAREYAEHVAKVLQSSDCRDSHDKPLGELRPAESAALSRYLATVVERQGGPTRVALELSADARPYVVLYAGILPLIEAEAKAMGRRLLLLSPDSGGEARSHLEFRAMTPFTIQTRVEFGTWDQLQPKPQNNFRLADLSRCWVVGNLDWSDKPLSGDAGELVRAAVQRVLRDGGCPALLLHQQGKTPVVPFPPVFGTEPAGKGMCFIATAACGSPLAEEVRVLREFRDRVLVRSAWGRAAVACYSRLSPPLARWIERRPAARRLVRVSFIRPLARAVSEGRRLREGANPPR